MKALLDQIVAKELRAAERAAEAKKADVQKLLSDVSARFKDGLRDAGLDWLLDYGEITFRWISEDERQVEAKWDIDPKHCHTLEVSGIRISASFHDAKRVYGTRSKSNAINGTEPVEFSYEARPNYRYSDPWQMHKKFDSMIVAARACFPVWAQEEKASRVSDAKKKSAGGDALHFHWNPDEAKARELYQTLCEIDPERKPEFDEKLAGWLETKALVEQRRTEEEARKVERQSVLDSYREVYAAWWKEANAIHEHNKRVAASVQNLYNAPLTLYELTYGIVAEEFDDPDWGEEGGVKKYVETRVVYVRTPGNNQGEFIGMDYAPIRYWHPVSTRSLTVQADTAPSSVHEFHGLPSLFDGDGFDIGVWYIKGSVDDSEIEAGLREKGWKEYPSRPDRPRGFEYRILNEVESRAEHGDEEPVHENDTDIPY